MLRRVREWLIFLNQWIIPKQDRKEKNERNNNNYNNKIKEA